jgi:ribosomal protein S18 acetylase RimI-like enzyme
MVLCMVESSLDIVRCPPEHFAEAMALVLREVRADQRGELVHGSTGSRRPRHDVDRSLYVALRENRLCGAAWGQRQPGNTAIFWPPQLLAGCGSDTASQLTQAVVQALDALGDDITQMLLPGRDGEWEAVLEPAEFEYLTDLLYLTCESTASPRKPPETAGLAFESYDESQRPRLADLIERTYVGTHDCPQLNDARKTDDVIDGYQATGEYRAENWLFAKEGSQDIGVLLLANHPRERQWELTYMGVVPEARGHGWGSALTRHALWLAQRAEIRRMLLAVDVANEPALAIYRHAGFIAWDRRAVFVRFRRRSGN